MDEDANFTPPATRSRSSSPVVLAPELDEAVGFWLRRAVGVADDLFAGNYAALEVNTQQYAVMMTVRHNPGCQPSALSAMLRISPNNLVPQIDSLVARGLIRRSLGTRDRRLRHLRLSPAGERFAEELEGRHEAIRREGERRMRADELDQLVRLLKLYVQSTV